MLPQRVGTLECEFFGFLREKPEDINLIMSYRYIDTLPVSIVVGKKLPPAAKIHILASQLSNQRALACMTCQ